MKNVVLRYLLPIVAICLLGLAVYHVNMSQPVDPVVSPPIKPAATPFTDTVAGAGLIEAQTENISIGSHVPGVVTEVLVTVGQKVEAGDPLFKLDDRQLRAQLGAREAALESSRAQLSRLKQMPRPEEIPIREAAVREAESTLTAQQDAFRRVRSLRERNMSTEEQIVQREQAVQTAAALLERARAELDLLRAGAWKEDIVVAEAAVKAAQADVDMIHTELERLTMRTLVAGEILQVNLRPGEFVGAPPSQTLILLGNVRQLRVRADVDEFDIPRFNPHGEAVGVLRGHPDKVFPLTFVRVEPYVIPKRSLTGENTERVDTRVLQVIYDVNPVGESLYVGQQLDIFVKVSGDAAASPPVAKRP